MASVLSKPPFSLVKSNPLLVCVSCRCFPPINPVQHLPCGLLRCSNCQLPEDHNCHGNLSVWAVQSLNEAEVRCDNPGCQYVSVTSEMMQHQCDFRLVKCETCLIMFKAGEVEQHKETCSIRCNYCDLLGPVGEIKEHEVNIKQCPFTNCMKNGLMHPHLQELFPGLKLKLQDLPQLNEQILFLIPELKKHSEENLALKELVNQLRVKVDQMEIDNQQLRLEQQLIQLRLENSSPLKLEQLKQEVVIQQLKLEQMMQEIQELKPLKQLLPEQEEEEEEEKSRSSGKRKRKDLSDPTELEAFAETVICETGRRLWYNQIMIYRKDPYTVEKAFKAHLRKYHGNNSRKCNPDSDQCDPEMEPRPTEETEEMDSLKFSLDD